MVNSFCRYFLVGASNRRIFVNILYFLFFNKNIKAFDLNGINLLFVYDEKYKNRKDYNDLVESFLSNNSCLKNEKLSLYSTFNPMKPFVYLISYFKYSFKKGRGISLKNIITFFCILEYRRFYQKAERLFSESKGKLEVTTFCDAHPYLNVVASSAKNNNLLTSTLQHGLYRKVDRKNPNSLAYRNFISDFIYVWDKSSRDALLKCNIPTSKIILRDYNICTKEYEHLNSGNCYGLVLNGPNGYSANKSLILLGLSIAKRDRCKLLIRLHPSDLYIKYLFFMVLNKKHIEDVKHCESVFYYSKVKFSLINNSGLIREFNILNHDYVTVDLDLDFDLKKISKNVKSIKRIKEFR